MIYQTTTRTRVEVQREPLKITVILKNQVERVVFTQTHPLQRSANWHLLSYISHRAYVNFFSRSYIRLISILPSILVNHKNQLVHVAQNTSSRKKNAYYHRKHDGPRLISYSLYSAATTINHVRFRGSLRAYIYTRISARSVKNAFLRETA